MKEIYNGPNGEYLKEMELDFNENHLFRESISIAICFLSMITTQIPKLFLRGDNFDELVKEMGDEATVLMWVKINMILIFIFGMLFLTSALMVRRVKWWRKWTPYVNTIACSLFLLPVKTYYNLEIALITIPGHIFQARQFHTQPQSVFFSTVFILSYDAFYIFNYFINSKDCLMEQIAPIFCYFSFYGIFSIVLGLKGVVERRERFFIHKAIEIQASENKNILKIFPEGLLISRVRVTKLGVIEFMEEQEFESTEKYLEYLRDNFETDTVYTNDILEKLMESLNHKFETQETIYRQKLFKIYNFRLADDSKAESDSNVNQSGYYGDQIFSLEDILLLNKGKQGKVYIQFCHGSKSDALLSDTL